MATEENETSNGWPLGLEILNMRLRVMATLQAAPSEPHSTVHLRSPSFSSFSSSNLDTEPSNIELVLFALHHRSDLRASLLLKCSFHMLPLELVLVLICELNQSTASFFQDHSVSLGRLIGIRPGSGGLCTPRRTHLNEERKSVKTVSSEVTTRQRPEMSQGICIPLLVGTLEKMSRSKSKTKR
ncbi:conserved hypothetical protein [Ricinus communis]|uniref:Uncharacterized protein n=1 Tax=Ricinus communis TaxID=3988 RepID=B9RBA1_RICCO|nr:conserved hypothetical protein [Ricinus communis]